MKLMIYVDPIWLHVRFDSNRIILNEILFFKVINMSQQLDCHSRMKASSSEKELIVPFGFNM